MTAATTSSDSLASLRSVALRALIVGAAGSFALMLHAGGRNRPIVLVPLFAAWDLSPFALLWLADRLSKQWSASTRRALYHLAILTTVGSLAVYIADIIWPRQAQPAFVYVAVPPASWIVIALVLAVTALGSRTSMGRRSDA